MANTIALSQTVSAPRKDSAPKRVVRLSRREVEVLLLISQGYSSLQVADIMFISKRTVDFHLANTFAKFNVSNRVRAIHIARSMGLLPFEPSPVTVRCC